MTRLFALAAALLALLSVGCTHLVPFTQEVRVEHGLTKADIKNLQFYASSRIVLRRELESGGKQITGSHKLLLVSGKTIEEVVVPEGTPGVAVAVDDSSIAISFDPGSQIVFTAGLEPNQPVSSPMHTFAEPPNPFPGNEQPNATPVSPALRGDGPIGNFWLAVDPAGRVPFQGRVFTADDDTLRAHLLIDAERLEQVVKSRKVLPGVRLGG